MAWPAFRRPGMSNQGVQPSSVASPGSPLNLSTMAPLASHTRSRVIAFTITRSRSMPTSSSLQRSGSSP